MLQRSWTVQQDEDESVPGAVYVGRASFRMVHTAATDPLPLPPPAVHIEAARIPTERIVLVAGSSHERRVSEKGSRRRPLSLVFGAAFGVGVMCTLAGQVVLHSREKQKLVGGIARSETSLGTPVAIVPAATPRALPGNGDEAGPLWGGGTIVAERNAEVAPRDFASPAGVSPGLGMRKSRTRGSRRAAKSGSAQNNHASARSGARWIDPFSVEVEGTPAAEKSDSNEAQDRQVWQDPFAK